MEDTDRPNRKSNMEKAEGDRRDSDPQDPQDDEPLVQRHPYRNDPTKLDVERSADEQSTVRNGGIGSGAGRRDPILPADDSTLNTKI